MICRLFSTEDCISQWCGKIIGIYILVDTYMRFLERGRELIAAQVVEKIVRSASWDKKQVVDVVDLNNGIYILVDTMCILFSAAGSWLPRNVVETSCLSCWFKYSLAARESWFERKLFMLFSINNYSCFCCSVNSYIVPFYYACETIYSRMIVGWYLATKLALRAE